MINEIFYTLKMADFFGKALMFEEKQSQMHNTLVGNFVSLLLITLSIVIGFLFGKKFI